MTLKEKLKWNGSADSWLKDVEIAQQQIVSRIANNERYYGTYMSVTFGYAIECYVEGNPLRSKEAGKLAIQAVMEYCYGEWRERLLTREGKTGHEAWKAECMWAPEIINALPWACALGDWEAARKIGEYPPDNRFPEAARAIGKSAWSWTLVTFFRGRPRNEVEHFLSKAEGYYKRFDLLVPVVRALLDKNEKEFKDTLLTYLAYYRKSEFKKDLDKILALDGTILYHLGLKQGYKVELPENVADHVIRFS